MSADKHRKRDRAFAMLRGRRQWLGSYNTGEPLQFTFTGPLDPTLRWLVEKGFGAVRRQAKGAGRCAGRNYFVETS